MIIGHEVSSVTLVANKEETIKYGEQQKYADIINYGSGDVYLSWRKAAVIDDPHCLLLKEGQSYELRTALSWQTLSLISTGTPKIQVVVF